MVATAALTQHRLDDGANELRLGSLRQGLDGCQPLLSHDIGGHRPIGNAAVASHRYRGHREHERQGEAGDDSEHENQTVRAAIIRCPS